MATNPGPQIGRFSNVDATKQAEQFIAFLEWIERLPPAVELRERSYELFDIHPGDTVIDLGCGTGRVVAELTERAIKAIGVELRKPGEERKRS